MLKRGLAFEQLTARGKAAFDHVAKALEVGQTIFDGGAFSGCDTMDILQAIVGDNPRLIWFNKSTIRRQTSLLGETKIILTGTITGDKRREMERELDQALHRVLRAIEEENPITDYDKLVCLYEYLQSKIVYDRQESRHSSTRRSVGDPQSHNAYGALVKGLAVCDGIAAAVSLVASAMGYGATTVHGNAARDGMTEDHAWNVIRVGDNCYHMDLTWDLSKSSTLGVWGYDYFCLDDTTISMDHQWPGGIVPRCGSTTLSWFHHNRCFANNLTQAGEILARYARSKTRVVRLRLADGVAVPGDERQTLGQMLSSALNAAGKRGSVQYVWNPYVRSLTAKLSQ